MTNMFCVPREKIDKADIFGGDLLSLEKGIEKSVAARTKAAGKQFFVSKYRQLTSLFNQITIRILI